MTRIPLLALAAVAAGFLAACSPADEPSSTPAVTTQDSADLAELLLLPSPEEPTPAEIACADLTDVEHMLCMVAGGPVPR